MSEREQRLEELSRFLYSAMESRKITVIEADLSACQVLDGKIAAYEAEIKRLAAEEQDQ